MKTDTMNPTTVLSKWARLLGMMLSLALMVSVTAFSYSNPTAIPLGTASTFGALAGSAITGTATINGDIGAVSAMDGTIHTNGGTIYGLNVSAVQNALGDLATALDQALNHRAPDVTDAGGVISGTLSPGIYSYTGASVSLNAPLILDGGAVPNAVFIIKTAAILDVSSTVTLAGTAVWSNVFWYVGSSATINNGSTFNGIILANTAITVNTGVTLPGAQLLAHGAAVTVNSTVLPVELVSFTAAANHMNAELTWSTATEVHNYGFEIQRRQNADWAKVGFVAGAGTSSSVKNYSYTDNNLSAGNYSYRLKQVDIDGSFSYGASVEVAISSAPQAFALLQNYPNPFNPSTVISYQLPVNSQVTLKVYNLLGQEVASLVNGLQQAGSHSVTFNTAAGTRALTTGVYVYRLQAGSFISMKKLVLMK